MKGNARREARSNGPPPSRSWTLAGCGSRERPAAADLLAGIMAARSAGLGRLHALAVDDRGGGAGVAADTLAIGHDQRVVDLLEHAFVPPRGKPAIGCLPGREVARQQPPGDTAAQHIEDGIDDLAPRPPPRAALLAGQRQGG